MALLLVLELMLFQPVFYSYPVILKPIEVRGFRHPFGKVILKEGRVIKKGTVKNLCEALDISSQAAELNNYYSYADGNCFLIAEKE